MRATLAGAIGEPPLRPSLYPCGPFLFLTSSHHGPRTSPHPSPPRSSTTPAHHHTCSGWKATAIGSNSQSATATLKADYKADMSLADAVVLALKTLTKAMDTTAPTSEKVEVAVLTRDAASGKITQRVYAAAETDAALAVIIAAMPAAAPVPPP